MPSTSIIEISVDALEKNIKFIQSLLDNKTKISSVVKGNAYGHGIHVIVPALEKLGICHFSVYSSSEARDVFKAQKQGSTIMVMGFVSEKDYPWIIKNNIEFYVSEIEELNMAIETAKKQKTKAIIHIDIETGMNRTGLTLKHLKKAIDIINNNRAYLEIRGATSHFAGAESIANHTRIRKQFRTFKNRLKLLSQYNISPQIKHIASSAATIVYPDTQMDMVRTGIITYGYWPTKETFLHYVHRKKDKSSPLTPVLKWSSQLICKKIVPEGDFIGYGMNYQAQQKTIIGIVPVGYCNGYSRSLSNNGHVLIQGQKAPVIGSVNMNMVLCDVTNINKVSLGGEVVLIGKQDDSEITFSSFSEMNNSLNYEILARLPENIKRALV